LQVATTALKEAPKADGKVGQAVEVGPANPRYVAESGGWRKRLVREFGALKASQGKPILTLGGASFAASLIEYNLVDEYRLIVHPVALGRGIPIFDKLPENVSLQLIEYRKFKSEPLERSSSPKSATENEPGVAALNRIDEQARMMAL
jgi:riboflavin biosynthesis pyrimidine reductase